MARGGACTLTHTIRRYYSARCTDMPQHTGAQDEEFNRSLQELKDVFFGERRAKLPLRTILSDLDVLKAGHLDAAAVTHALLRINPPFDLHALDKLLDGFVLGGAGDEEA